MNLNLLTDSVRAESIKAKLRYGVDGMSGRLNAGKGLSMAGHISVAVRHP